LERKQGEKGEDMKGFIGRSRSGNWCLNLLGIKSGRHSLAAEVTAALMAGGGRRLTGGSHESVRGREKERYRFGKGVPGPRADSDTGPNRSPGSFSYFFLLFSFSFSVFLFLL
jgi:hypothetical protein